MHVLAVRDHLAAGSLDPLLAPHGALADDAADQVVAVAPAAILDDFPHAAAVMAKLLPDRPPLKAVATALAVVLGAMSPVVVAARPVAQGDERATADLAGQPSRLIRPARFWVGCDSSRSSTVAIRFVALGPHGPEVFTAVNRKHSSCHQVST